MRSLFLDGVAKKYLSGRPIWEYTTVKIHRADLSSDLNEMALEGREPITRLLSDLWFLKRKSKKEGDGWEF